MITTCSTYTPPLFILYASPQHTGLPTGNRRKNENNISWQTAELGKIDVGGGGTVAMYIANLDIDTIDIGVPVLSMHAPYEVTAKNDVYMAYKAFSVFIK